MAGPSVIGALRVSLGLDSAQFDSGLKGASGKLTNFGKIAASGFGIVAGAATLAGASIALAVRGAVNSFDELSKTSQKTGVAVEALSRLKYAGELADVSFAQLATGFKKLSVNMAATAKDGTGPAAGAFKALGLSVTNASGQLKSGDVVFSEVADKFASMRDGAGKTALAIALFGKSGADLIPLLNAGAGGLKQMGDEAAELGLVIDGQTGQAAEAFNDNLTRLKSVGEGVATQLAAQLAPTLATLSGQFVGVAKNANVMHGIGLLLGGTLKVLGSLAIAAASSFAILGRGIASISKAIVQVFRGDFAGAVATIGQGITDNLKTLTSGAKSIAGIWTGAGAQVAKIAPGVSDQIAAPIAQGASKAAKGVKALKAAADDAADAAKYIAAERKRLENSGLSGDQVQVKELQAKAAEFLAKGLLAEAAAVLGLADAYIKLGDSRRADLVVVQDLKTELPSLADDTSDIRSAAEKAADAFYQIGYAVDDVFRGIAGRDFVGAFSGLTRALKQVQDAFKSTGTAADRYAAIAGVGSAVGAAVGGKVGGAISGAASGALVGSRFGIPGAVIGGVLGGALGLFGASKAKKAAKKQAAAQAAAAAAQKAAEEAATQRELEIRLMEAAGDAAAAQAAREADLLASLSPANAALQKQVLALEHEADARAAAAALTAQQRGLEAELASLAGDSAAALKVFREDELAQLPAALRPLKLQIYATVDAMDALATATSDWEAKQAAADNAVAEARDAAAEAAEREVSALEATRDKFNALADDLANARRSLRGTAAGGLNPRQLAATTRAEFNRISALAAGGDAQAAGDLPAAVQAFLAANSAVAPTAKAQANDIAAAKRSLAAAELAARNQASIAQQQLDSLHAQIDATLGVQKAVESLAGAFANLATALLSQQETAANAAKALADLAAKLPPPPATPVTTAAEASAGATSGAGTSDLAKDLAAELIPPLLRIADNTFTTSDTLDDVVNGPLAFKTAAA